MRYSFLMSLMNYLLARCIASLVINQSCLYYVFTQLPNVVPNVNALVCNLYHLCHVFHHEDDDSPSDSFCYSYNADTNLVATPTPSFKNSYTCDTAILVSNIPDLLYSYIFNDFIFPIIRFIALLQPINVDPSVVACSNIEVK
jgi:hypothetical protein